jgi:hypothetical protein
MSQRRCSPPRRAARPSGAQIRAFYAELLASRPQFTGDVRPALVHGDLALTSTRFPGGATAEIARQQPGGGWRWIADQPNVVS